MRRRLGSYLRKLRRDERGSVLVEMTLITPLMVSLSAGVFEFGNLVQQKLMIEAGLRDAARYVARCNVNGAPPPNATCEARAANIAATGTYDGSGSARVYGWTAGSVTVDSDHHVTPVDPDGDGDQDYRSSTANVYTVRVTTSFTFTGTSLLAFLGIGPITLTGSHEERYMGW